MDYLPIFTNLKNRPVLVVGGGTVAQRKVDMLLKAGARVSIVAKQLNTTLQTQHTSGNVQWLGRDFSESQLDNVYLVIATTDDAALNRRVFDTAEAKQRLCNTVDDQAHCNFIFPAIIDRSPIQLAISSGGTAPVLARLLREKLEALLPQNLGKMAQTAARWRQRVKEALPSISQRRRFWERLFTAPTFQHLTATHQPDETDAFLAEQLSTPQPNQGEVTLVGAGPGDAGLLTLKGLQKIQAADVVLYDALVSEQILELVRRDAEKIFVGKRAGNHHVRQEETNRMLVELARQGKRVVRLKGGDPFVFGRGGEELETLKAAGITFEVVPGITAALGATAYAGIPLTHRDHAQTAMFITGHCRVDGKTLSWSTLAQGNQTLVVYMGTIKAAELAAGLMANGRSGDTPAAVISKGTLPEQKVYLGRLKDLPELAAQAESPALMVIGETAALRQELAWFGTAPTEQPASRSNATILAA